MEPDEKIILWWGYKHISGSYQAKRFFDFRDIQEAKESPFVTKVIGPFEVPDDGSVNPREYALHHLKTII